jgi:putative ABC transport system ATP-binding protein
MIELKDLQFAYGDAGFRLRIDRLSVEQSRRVCWIGPSGSGKTTLLHLVAGIFAPESGEVRTCSVELTALRESARRNFRIANIGLVFQDFALFDYLSVLDNILLPYRISGTLRMAADIRKRAEELARRVGLEQKLARRPTQLSQGERQRVAVCRAIITNPKLILSDEPTANLDAARATRVLDALDEYADEQQATLVVVSHDREVMARFDETLDVSGFCTPSHPISDGGGNNA